MSERDHRERTPEERLSERADRISGTYLRSPLEAPPTRPATVGLLLLGLAPLPVLQGAQAERIVDLEDAAPTQTRAFNAFVIDARASPSVVGPFIRAAARRTTWAEETGGLVPATYLVGSLDAETGGLAMAAGIISYPSTHDLGYGLSIASSRAAASARAHAAADPASQAVWARGSLGEWIGTAHPQLRGDQREVLALAALGLEPAAIAHALGKTERVIRYHVEQIRLATRTTSLAQAAGMFQRALGIEPSPYVLTAVPVVPRPLVLGKRTPSDGFPRPGKPDPF